MAASLLKDSRHRLKDCLKAHTRTLHEMPGTVRCVMECDDGKVGRLVFKNTTERALFVFPYQSCLHATVGYRLIGDLGCM